MTATDGSAQMIFDLQSVDSVVQFPKGRQFNSEFIVTNQFGNVFKSSTFGDESLVFTDLGGNVYEVSVLDSGAPLNLTYAAGENGAISGDTNQIVAVDADGTSVTAVADLGYSFWKWSDDLVDNPRTDTHVTASISVAAIFYGATNSLTYIAGENGSIPADAVQQVALGKMELQCWQCRI